MTKIQEIEQKLDECQKALAELKESKKEGKWKPRNGEMYWFRNINGFRDWDTWTGKAEDNFRYNNIPIFPAQPACERYWHFMDTVKEKSYEFSKEEWEDDAIEKMYICHDFDKFNEEDEDFIVLEDVDYKHCGSIYFKAREDAQYIIDNFKDELMEYWI